MFTKIKKKDLIKKVYVKEYKKVYSVDNCFTVESINLKEDLKILNPSTWTFDLLFIRFFVKSPDESEYHGKIV